MNPINKITSTNNIQNISFKSIERNTKLSASEKEQEQTEQSVVNPLYYQSINGIKTTTINKKAIEQSRFFNEENYIPHTEKILDGFKDGGSFSKCNNDGNISEGQREVIVVDRSKDIHLQDIIEDFKEQIKIMNTDETTYCEFTLNYVYENFVKDLNVEEIEYQKGKEVLLGDILMNSKPVCRHIALLYKILADEIGLQTDYIRGEFQIGDEGGRHAWVQVHEDGCTSICDPSNNIETGQSKFYARRKDGTSYLVRYDMPQALKDDFEDEDLF